MRSRNAGFVLLGAVLVALLAAGCGNAGSDGDGTRSYVGSTDDLALYVTWNRDGNKLTGALTQGRVNEDTRTVQTSRASFTGTISGSSVSLDLRGRYGEASTLSGRLDGEEFVLEYLQAQAGVVTVKLEQGKAGVFNAALSTLRDRVEQAKAAEQSETNESSEKERVAQRAQTVHDDIAALKTAITDAGAAKGRNDRSDLARLRRDLQTLRDHTQAAMRADELSACSSAATVQSDLSTLEGHVATLGDKQTTRGERTRSVGEAIDELRQDFLALQSEDRSYVPPDAPTQKTVARAIEQARRKLRRTGASGTSTTKAVDAILKEARELNGRVSARCRAAGT